MTTNPKENRASRKPLLEVYTFEEVIGLFSEPHVFLRELVQNAIDAQVEAGSKEPIEVTTEFRPYDDRESKQYGPGNGLFTIQVVDHGTGMTRHDVDTKLTQLCNIAKEDAEQMIGSYGVGFVSVFAFDPMAVIVDTGCGGEGWRLLFKSDRRFDRISREYEFKGTKVQVLKEVHASDVEQLQLELRSTLKRWCRMSTMELRFEGEPINERFCYTGDSAWSPAGSGDTFRRLSVRPRTDDDSHYEYYVNGFLIEKGSDKKLSLPGLSYRVDSPVLRYLPTRDKVERDHALIALMQEIRKTVESHYVPHLISLLAASPNDVACGVLSHHLPSVSKKDALKPILPACDGSKLSLLQLARQVRGNKLHWSSKEGKHDIVFWDGKSPGLGQLLTMINRIQGSVLRRIANRCYPPGDLLLVEEP